MAVNIKIYPYRKNRTNSFNRYNIIGFPILPIQSLDRRFYTRTPYTEIEINSIIITYGIKGRHLHAQRDNGEWTRAVLIGYVMNSGNVYLHHYDWSNQIPNIGNYATTHVHEKDDYRYLKYPYDVLDCQNILLEQDVKVNFYLETNQVMDLQYSFGEFIIHANTEAKTFFDTYWSSVTAIDDYENVFGIELFLDGVSDAWMCSRRDNIIYDELEDNYKIKCYDWVKMQLEEIGNEWSPFVSYPYEDVPITVYLDKVFDAFKTEGVKTISELGSMPDTFSRTEYRSRDYLLPGLGETWSVSPEENMTVSDFLIEIQKHYAAFIYYDKNRVLRITRRDHTGATEINIDNIIQEETFEETRRVRDFQRLVVNFTETSEGITYFGWYSIEADPSSPLTGFLKISEGLSEADIERLDGKLDLRQSLPYPIFETAVFEYRGINNRYEDYKELLNDLKVYRCTVNSLSIDLFTKVIYNTYAYRVNSVSKDYISGSSEIEMVKII